MSEEKGKEMKTDKEFVDSVYEKYEKTKTQERRRRSAKKRGLRYVLPIAACLVLFVGILGVTKLNDQQGSDMEKSYGSDQTQEIVNIDDKSAEAEANEPENNEQPTETDQTTEPENEPFITDQGLVNEVTAKESSILGIELTKSSGSTIDSRFFTDKADISNLVSWLGQNAGTAMSEATFYSNYDSASMPETHFVMSVQVTTDPADAIDVYVVTDTAPGF